MDMNVSPWIKWLEPQTDAVVVQIVDGKPIVTLMVKNEAKTPELEELAQRVLRGLHLTKPPNA
jgi:hypothetical protein